MTSIVTDFLPFEVKSKAYYVHAPQLKVKNIKSIKRIVNYVCRYAGHLAMNESRIIKYDKEKKIVYYYYDPHEDDAILNEKDKKELQYVTEHAFDFISKLIVHIPEDNVHTTIYYGFYANHSSIDILYQPKLYKMDEINKMKSNLKLKDRLLASYKYDPLLCHCGATMEIVPNLCYFLGYSREDG